MDIDFGESPEVLKVKYMDVYENVFAEVVTTNRFDENVDLSTTYLGKIDMKRGHNEGRGKFSNLSARFCYRKSIEWERNVRFYWRQVQVNLIRQNLII